MPECIKRFFIKIKKPFYNNSAVQKFYLIMGESFSCACAVLYSLKMQLLGLFVRYHRSSLQAMPQYCTVYLYMALCKKFDSASVC